MKCVKIGTSLFVVFLLSFTPEMFAANTNKKISGFFDYAFYINNLANFFFYLMIDGDFRRELKKLFCKCGGGESLKEPTSRTTNQPRSPSMGSLVTIVSEL